MSEPPIHGKRRVITASMVLTALGDALMQIKSEDGLTWGDLGVILGKSEDQAAKYAEGSAEMGAYALYRAKMAWNGRFTGKADRLIGEASDPVDAQLAQSRILKAALALSVALEDGDLSIAEVQSNRSTLENARDAIDAQLARLGVRAA